MRTSIGLSEEMAAFALFGLSVVCAGVLFFLPRAAAPIELPSLVLPAAEVQAALRTDALTAKKAPPAARTQPLDAMLLEQGRIERLGTESSTSYDARRAALVREYKALVAEAGEDAAMGLRAQAMQRLERALDLELPKAQAEAVVGAMHHILDRDGASRDGYLTAPRFVVRTLYKARWNLLHGLAATHRFERVEKLAYHGWQALHIGRVAVADRANALDNYQRAGGQRFEEAWGVLAFRIGEFQQSVESLTLAHRKNPSLRLRNYLRGAKVAAGAAARAP